MRNINITLDNIIIFVYYGARPSDLVDIDSWRIDSMKPVIGQCPICQDTLHVTRLHCRNCDTSIEGHFTLGRLYYLSSDQLNFVDTFLRCEGKIKWVEKELGLSYPAVRARLTDVIRTMGYEVGSSEENGVSEETRIEVLTELNKGNISAEEALDLLRSDS
jgi:hypothetical protein